LRPDRLSIRPVRSFFLAFFPAGGKFIFRFSAERLPRHSGRRRFYFFLFFRPAGKPPGLTLKREFFF
jgi:hypothetical protein